MTAIPEKPDIDIHEQNSWYTLFRRLDVNNQGVIPVQELRTAVLDASTNTGLSRDEADHLLMDVDKNNDEFVDFTEFAVLMAKAKHMHMKRLLFYAAQSVLCKKGQTEAHRYLLEYNCFPPPLFMILITVFQIAFYVGISLHMEKKLSAYGPVPFDSVLILNPSKPEEVWRFLTYMLIHVGYLHLIVNIVIQLLLGLPLELVHKLWRIGGLYMLGVITGGVLVRALDPTVYLGGASAGVYALISAHVSNVIINWSEMEFNWIRALVLGLIIAGDVALAIWQRYGAQEDSKTSYVAHIGGFVAGLLLGVVLLRNLKWKKWERVVWWACLVSYILFLTVCIILIYAPPVFPNKKTY